MNNYWDKYGRLHDQPCINGEPSSNNGWIYTAYADKAGVPVDMDLLNDSFHLCRYDERQVLGVNVSIARSPDKKVPPISRDEILGLASLGVLHEVYVPSWNFSPYRIPKFSIIKLVKQLDEILPGFTISWTGKWYNFKSYRVTFDSMKHRNYFWKNNLDQLYRFAFSVPVQDRHFILKRWNKFHWYNPVHVFYAAVAKVDSLLPKKSGIKWLKYGGEENRKAMVEEFPEDHPIRQKLGL